VERLRQRSADSPQVHRSDMAPAAPDSSMSPRESPGQISFQPRPAACSRDAERVKMMWRCTEGHGRTVCDSQEVCHFRAITSPPWRAIASTAREVRTTAELPARSGRAWWRQPDKDEVEAQISAVHRASSQAVGHSW